MARLRTRIGVGLATLTLGMSIASAAAFAQSTSYYPSDRKLNDNGSVSEPGSTPSASTSTRHTGRRAHLINYAPQPSRTAKQHWPNDRKPDDNGSVDEPVQ
jgi:hypothetical protein